MVILRAPLVVVFLLPLRHAVDTIGRLAGQLGVFGLWGRRRRRLGWANRRLHPTWLCRNPLPLLLFHGARLGRSRGDDARRLGLRLRGSDPLSFAAHWRGRGWLSLALPVLLRRTRHRRFRHRWRGALAFARRRGRLGWLRLTLAFLEAWRQRRARPLDAGLAAKRRPRRCADRTRRYADEATLGGDLGIGARCRHPTPRQFRLAGHTLHHHRPLQDSFGRTHAAWRSGDQAGRFRLDRQGAA